MNSIENTLKKLRIKIWIHRIIKSLIFSLGVFSISFFMFMIVIHFYPVVYSFQKAMGFMSIFIFVGLLFGILKRPTLYETASIGDQLGFQERFVTYLEYKEKKDCIIKIFIEEVKEALEDFPILEKYKIKTPVKLILANILMISLSIGIYFIPSSSMEIASEKENIHKELKEEAKKVEELKKEIQKKNPSKNMITSLEELQKELENAYDYESGAAHVSSIQEQIENENDDIFMSEILDGISSKQKLQSQWSKNHEEALENIKNTHFSKDEKEKMKENIKNMMKTKNEDKKEKLKKINTALEKNNTGKEIVKALENGKKSKEVKESLDVKLDAMKERLLAKGEKGFKGNGGEEKLSDFAKGESKEEQNGELSQNSSDALALGNMGNQSMKSPSGVGGDKIDASDGEALEGKVNRQDQSTRIGENKGDSSYLKGQWNDGGAIKDGNKEEVSSRRGDESSLEGYERDFKNTQMDYVEKLTIPIKHKQLVLEYFKKLNGGEEDGRK
ncbi:hypothetical protein [Anaerophilus nitritogenes]|uniref:hypothetical protein n=1 Tax=Anaerophilus nitritogenes TaxID=2498136 RepID=UPI00101C3F68|nr:hypothetical protein [Anaerophilus nitritogenes]